jgi:hypothetical protein
VKASSIGAIGSIPVTEIPPFWPWGGHFHFQSK